MNPRGSRAAREPRLCDVDARRSAIPPLIRDERRSTQRSRFVQRVGTRNSSVNRPSGRRSMVASRRRTISRRSTVRVLVKSVSPSPPACPSRSRRLRRACAAFSKGSGPASKRRSLSSNARSVSTVARGPVSRASVRTAGAERSRTTCSPSHASFLHGRNPRSSAVSSQVVPRHPRAGVAPFANTLCVRYASTRRYSDAPRAPESAPRRRGWTPGRATGALPG